MGILYINQVLDTMPNEKQQQNYRQSDKIHDPLREKLLMQKGLDAFESMYAGRQALKGGTISPDAYRMYLRNFHADPEVKARAEYLSGEYGTPQNAGKSLGMSNNIESLALGGASANLIKKIKDGNGYIDRRTFLVAAAIYAAACGNKGEGLPDPGPAPGPSPIYVSFQVPVEGLLRQTKLNGELRIPGKPLVIPIVNGIMAVEPKHELMAGQVHNNAEMRTEQGVARVTPVKVTSSNILVPIGYADVPLDAADDQRIFDIWANTRYPDGGLPGVIRWDKYASRIRKFVYDRTKFKNTGQAIVEDGQMNPLPTKALNTIEYVVNNYAGPFVNNLTPSGGLIRESESSERPTGFDDGWLIYRFGDDVRVNGNPAAIAQGHNAWTHRGEITNGTLDLNLQNFHDLSSAMINDPNNGLAAIAIDTHESLLASTNASFPILTNGNTFRPLEEILAVSKIQYMRRNGNTSNGVPDYQAIIFP